MIKKFNVLLSGSSVSTFDGSRLGFMTGVFVINHFLSDLNLRGIDNCQFYGHDFSVDNANLVRKFYPGIKLITDQQPNFERDHLAKIKPFDKFETNFHRNRTAMSRVSLQATSAFAFSRSKVAGMLQNTVGSTSKNSLGLLSRWDIGYRGSFIVNTPRIYNDFSDLKINLPYYKDNDTGCADMWIYGPLKEIGLFAASYDHHNDTIYENNNISRLIQTGWPYSSTRKTISHQFYSLFRAILPKLNRFGFRLTDFAKFIEYKWHSTAYKSVNVLECQRRFSLPELLNNHIFLKAFILDKIGFSNIQFLKEKAPRQQITRGKFLYPKETIAILGEQTSVDDFEKYFAPLFNQYCDVRFYQNSATGTSVYDCHNNQNLNVNLDADLCKSNGITKLIFLPSEARPNPSFDPITAGLILLYLSGTQFNYMTFVEQTASTNCDLPGAYQPNKPSKKKSAMCIYEIDFLDTITDGYLLQCVKIMDKIKAMPLNYYEMAEEFELGETDIKIKSSPAISQC
jgi:hypothetical protein